MGQSRQGLNAILYLLAGIVVAGAIATFIGAALIHLTCGTGGQPTSVFAGLQLAISGSGDGYATPAVCVPPVTATRVVDVIAVLLLLALGVVGTIGWFRYRQSDRYFIRDLKLRDGLAKPGEIRRFVSAKAVLRRATTVRP